PTRACPPRRSSALREGGIEQPHLVERRRTLGVHVAHVATSGSLHTGKNCTTFSETVGRADATEVQTCMRITERFDDLAGFIGPVADEYHLAGEVLKLVEQVADPLRLVIS